MSWVPHPGQHSRPSRSRRQRRRTTELFLDADACWPNAIAADPQGRGFWIRSSVTTRGWNAWLLEPQGPRCCTAWSAECVDLQWHGRWANGFVVERRQWRIGAQSARPRRWRGVFHDRHEWARRSRSSPRFHFGAKRTMAEVPFHGSGLEGFGSGPAVDSVQPAGGLWCGTRNPVLAGMRLHVFPPPHVETDLHGNRSQDGNFIWQV